MSEPDTPIYDDLVNAPPCDRPGCDRIGVIEQVVYDLKWFPDPTWTNTYHWCVMHDPEARDGGES